MSDERERHFLESRARERRTALRDDLSRAVPSRGVSSRLVSARLVRGSCSVFQQSISGRRAHT